MPHILFVNVETTSGVKFEIGKRLLSCGWLISFGWKNFSYMHFTQTSSGTWKQAMDWLIHIFFYQLCYAGKFCAKKWMMKYFKFSLLECMFICIKMHQLIAASFQAVELSCFKVQAKNSINHFCIGAGKKKPHLYELPSQINLDIFHFLSPNCVILCSNVKSFLCPMGCQMQVKGNIRIT